MLILEFPVPVSPGPRQHQPSANVQLDIQSVSMEWEISIVGELSEYVLLLRVLSFPSSFHKDIFIIRHLHAVKQENCEHLTKPNYTVSQKSFHL